MAAAAEAVEVAVAASAGAEAAAAASAPAEGDAHGVATKRHPPAHDASAVAMPLVGTPWMWLYLDTRHTTTGRLQHY